MKFTINISNKFFFTFIAIAFVACLAIVAYAYNDFVKGKPPVFGHSSDEVNIKLPNSATGTEITLQKVIDDGYLSSKCESLGTLGETPSPQTIPISLPEYCKNNRRCFLHLYLGTNPATKQILSTIIFNQDANNNWWTIGAIGGEAQSGKNGDTNEVVILSSNSPGGGTFGLYDDAESYNRLNPINNYKEYDADKLSLYNNAAGVHVIELIACS